MPASIACAKAGVTTGEWGEVLRQGFGEYRAPTGVGRSMRNDSPGIDDLRAEVDRMSKKLGRRMKFLVGKPGLDGHSNGAEQVAVRARDAGMDVVYEGIRLTPAEIVRAARDEDVHVVGLSILSGSHLPLVKDVVAGLREAGLDDVPVVVGGIIPPEDAPRSSSSASPPSTRRRISSSIGSCRISWRSWMRRPRRVGKGGPAGGVTHSTRSAVPTRVSARAGVGTAEQGPCQMADASAAFAHPTSRQAPTDRYSTCSG